MMCVVVAITRRCTAGAYYPHTIRWTDECDDIVLYRGYTVWRHLRSRSRTKAFTMKSASKSEESFATSMNCTFNSGISVINVEAALKNEPSANLGQIPSGYFPRNFALSPDKTTVLVSNFASQQIMAIDLSSLP